MYESPQIENVDEVCSLVSRQKNVADLQKYASHIKIERFPNIPTTPTSLSNLRFFNPNIALSEATQKGFMAPTPFTN